MPEFNWNDFARRVGEMPPQLRTAVFASLEEPEKVADQIDSAKRKRLPLAGQACLLKDNFDVLGFPTRASSRFLNRTVVSLDSEGPLLKTVRKLGLAIPGKTQMNEFAYGLDGANPHYGNCPHPTIAGRMSGGSSSGSAWAVANRLVPIAFGTDTGGSIRVPSAFCGIFGFRLPPGPWAVEGCVPLAPTFDSAGWMTSEAEDLTFFTRALLDLPSEPEPKPLRFSAIEPLPPSFLETARRAFGCAPIAFDQGEELMDPAVVRAFNVLQSQEAYTIHREWLAPHQHEYDPAVLQRIRRAEEWTPSDRSHADETRKRTIDRLSRLFAHSDVGLLPVSLDPAGSYPMEAPTREKLLAYTAPASLAGLPVLTIPVPLPNGEVSGLQCLLPPERWKSVLNLLL